jgi:hypothetical protein
MCRLSTSAAALLISLLLAGTTLAQDEAASAAGPLLPTVSSADADIEEVALGSFGLSAGFPGYQMIAASAGVQYRSLGVAVKGSFTAAGPYLGLAVRGYPPIPGPVPLYLGVGAGFYGESTALELTAGGHIPIAENFRLNLEAGASRVSSFGETQWLPVVSAGISYVVPFLPSEVTPGSPGSTLRRTVSGSRNCGGEPDEEALVSAFSRTLQRFIANGRATYAGTYTDLNYDYRITDVAMDGNDGSVTIEYSGSVRTILGGATESAAGTASASFRWNGCSWSRTSLDY